MSGLCPDTPPGGLASWTSTKGLPLEPLHLDGVQVPGTWRGAGRSPGLYYAATRFFAGRGHRAATTGNTSSINRFVCT